MIDTWLSMNPSSVKAHRFRDIEDHEGLQVTSLLKSSSRYDRTDSESSCSAQVRPDPHQATYNKHNVQLAPKYGDDDLRYSSDEDDDSDDELSVLSTNLIQCPILEERDDERLEMQSSGSLVKSDKSVMLSPFHAVSSSDDSHKLASASSAHRPPRSPTSTRRKVRFSRYPPKVVLLEKPFPRERILAFYSREEIDNIMLQYLHEACLVSDEAEVGEGEEEV